MPPNMLSLRAGEYEDSLNELRVCINKDRSGYFDGQPLLPFGQTEEVHLQLKGNNLYIIGFKGKGGGKGGWYRFEDQANDGWAADKPSCGVEGNYNKLPKVDTISASDVKDLKKFAEFEKNSDKPLDGSLVVIAAAVVSEALRFTEVEILFTKLFDGKINSVELQELKERLFVNWADLSLKPISGLRMKLVK